MEAGAADAYTLLGVPRGASLQEIKTAYKAKAKQFHPDLAAPAERAAAERYFKEITSAYTRLTSHGAAWHEAQAAWHAEAMAGGHGAYARAGAGTAAAAAKAAPKFSNGLVASVLALPILLSVFHLSRAYENWGNDQALASSAAYLRDDLRPKMKSTGRMGIAAYLSSLAGERSPKQREEAAEAARLRKAKEPKGQQAQQQQVAPA